VSDVSIWHIFAVVQLGDKSGKSWGDSGRGSVQHGGSSFSVGANRRAAR